MNKAVREDNFQPVAAALKEKIKAGDKVAQLALADLYLLGQGMKPEPQEAVKIYTQLAKDNDPIALYRLAPLYCEGNGVNPDLAECYKYMLLAKNMRTKLLCRPFRNLCRCWTKTWIKKSATPEKNG